MHRLFVLLAVLLAAPALAQPDLAGDWSGPIELGGTELVLILHLQPVEGGYAVTMDVPAQAAYGFPADTATVAGDTLAFAAPELSASYAGAVATDRIAGTWTQNGRAFPLTLTRYEAPAEAATEAPKAGPKPARGDLTGAWDAALALPGGGEVRLTLHLTRTEDGYTAAVTGPGGERQPLEGVTVNGRSVAITNTTPPIEIVGTVSDDEGTIEGEWRQGGQKLPVTFTRG